MVVMMVVVVIVVVVVVVMMEPTFLGILAPLAPPIERLDRGFRS